MKRRTPSFLFNSASAYLPLIVDVLLKLIIVRIILVRLGSELLGTWGILKTATTIPLFLQQGLSFAIFVETSRKSHHESHSAEALTISACFGGLISLSILLFAPFLASFFRIPQQYYPMAVTAFRIASAGFFFTSISSVFIQVLQGLGRFDLASFLVTFGSLLESTLCVIALYLGYQILGLLLVELSINLLTIPVAFLMCRKVLGRTPDIFSIRSAAIWSLIRGTAGQLSVASLAKIIWELDAVLIPRFFGISTMASYWIAQRLVYTWRTFLWTGAWPAVPAIAQSSSSESRMQRIHWLQVCLAVPMGAFLWNFAGSIIHLWTGAADPIGLFVMRVLILAGLIDFLPATLVSFLYTQGKVFAVARISLLAAVLKIILSTSACLTSSLPLLLFSTAGAALLFAVGIFVTTSAETSQSPLRLLQPVLLAATASAICVFIFQNVSPSLSWNRFLLQSILFIGGVSLILFLLMRIFFNEIYQELIAYLRKRRTMEDYLPPGKLRQ